MADTCLSSSVDTGMKDSNNGLDSEKELDTNTTDMEAYESDNRISKSFLVAKRYFDPSTIRAPTSLTELITCLHGVFNDGNDVCVEYVQSLMTSYVSNAQDWKRFAKFDKYKYTRNLVDEGNGKYNLMILCWNEGQGSGIHSHADSHCFLKVLSGDIKEEQYFWPDTSPLNTITSNGEEMEFDEDDQSMKKKAEFCFHKDQCAYINDSIGLHRVENTSHLDKAVTLHLYSPPFQECQCFDQRSGRVSTSKMTFWSKYGKRTPYGKNPESVEPCTMMEDN